MDIRRGITVGTESEVAQSCPILRDPMDCSPPDSSVRGTFQARVLEWVAIAFSVTNLDSVLKKQRHHFINKGPYMVWFFQ